MIDKSFCETRLFLLKVFDETIKFGLSDLQNKKSTRFRFTNFKKLENKTSTKPTVAEVSAKFFLRHGVCFSRNLCQRSEKNFFAFVLKPVRKVFDKSLKSLSEDSHACFAF